MSDLPEKTSLTDALASLLLENRQAIGQALFRATQRAVAAHHAQRLQQMHRTDILQRQVVELFTRLARPQATPDPTHAARSDPRRGDSENHAEYDALAAERARIQQEKRLLRARQARAREEMELEQLRRETEAMEAILRDLRAGKDSTADADATGDSARAVDLEAPEPPSSTGEGPPRPPRSTDEPARTGSAAGHSHLDRTTDKAGESILAAQASLEDRSFPDAIYHADIALVALRKVVEMAPELAVGLLPLRAAALSIASEASIEIGEIIRGLDLLDDHIETARAVAEHDPTPNNILHHIRALLRKGDLQLQLGRVDQANELFQDTHARLQHLADDAPSERVLNEIVLLSRKLDSISSRYHTH